MPQNLFFEKDRCTKKRISVGVIHYLHGPEISLLNCHHWKMSAERMGLFWTCLDLKKFDKALKCIASDFQCDALHPQRRTTLLVHAIGKGMCKLPVEQKQCLELIQALRDSGASWTQACQSNMEMVAWKTADPENSKMSVHYGAHTALSFVQAWLELLDGKTEWQSDTSYLLQVLACF